ncbi:MAG: hypothetical protein IPL92_05230 [Saprospiraceae bacterium]|nr:hypothetical protein [Candidatus Opimibacter iunctus]
MTSYPDPLFREGLEHYRKPAPASAWERIESGLDKKKHKSPWLKIAACLTLLIATMFMLFQHNQTDSTLATTTKKSTTVTLNPDAAITDATGRQEIGDRKQEAGNRGQESGDRRREIVNRKQEAGDRKQEIGDRKQGEDFAQQTLNKKRITNSYQLTNVQKSERMEESVSPKVETPIASLNETNEKTTSPAQLTTVEERTDVVRVDASTDTRGTSISYSADMVNERFTKKECVAEATPEKKNASGLQKVIEKGPGPEKRRIASRGSQGKEK